MFRKLIVLICFTWLVSQYSNIFVWSDETVQEEKTELVKPAEEKKSEFKEFDQVVKGSQNYKGLFSLYLQKTSLYCCGYCRTCARVQSHGACSPVRPYNN